MWRRRGRDRRRKALEKGYTWAFSVTAPPSSFLFFYFFHHVKPSLNFIQSSLQQLSRYASCTVWKSSILFESATKTLYVSLAVEQICVKNLFVINLWASHIGSLDEISMLCTFFVILLPTPPLCYLRTPHVRLPTSCCFGLLLWPRSLRHEESISVIQSSFLMTVMQKHVAGDAVFAASWHSICVCCLYDVHVDWMCLRWSCGSHLLGILFSFLRHYPPSHILPFCLLPALFAFPVWFGQFNYSTIYSSN